MSKGIHTITGFDCYNKDGIDFTKIFVQADIDPDRGSGFSTSAMNFGTSANGGMFRGVTFPLQAELTTAQYSDGKGGFKKPVITEVRLIAAKQP